MHASSARVSQPTLLIVSQVYPPDPTAVGQHLADVAERMVTDGWNVVVYTASRGYDDPAVRYAKHENRAGVTIRRLPLSSFGKSSIALRLMAGLLFCVQAVWRGAFAGNVRAVLVSTSPPFSNVFGVLLAWWHRAPLTWWVMDLNPDQMVRLGKAKPTSLSVRVFDWFNRITLRNARAVVVLDDFMKERVLAKAEPKGKVHVLPPWSHEELREPIARDNNPFRRQHQLQHACVIMYSGNHGFTNPLDTVLLAAQQLRDHPALRFVFIGGGVRKPEIEAFILGKHLQNSLSLPYQPLDQLKYTLPAADVHLVSISTEAVGVSHSCKIYGAMAVGRPIIALGPMDSHVGQIMAAHQCGWTIEHGDVSGLGDLLLRVAEMTPAERDEVGERGARAARQQFAPAGLIKMMCGVITG